MSEHQKDSARTGENQALSHHLTPHRLAQAEKTNALRSLQRATRRCAKHLGRGATAVLLDLVQAELRGGK